MANDNSSVSDSQRSTVNGQPAPASSRSAWLQIHLCVILWGFTAILGRVITLPASSLVVWRMVLVAVALLVFPSVWRGLRQMQWRLVGIYAFIGAVIALHWLTFYGAVKLANASVAATCLALSPVFLALIEPLIAARKFSPFELLLGIAVVPGVALVVGGTPSGMQQGIIVGSTSAVFVAIFSAMNKRYAGRADPTTITFVEMCAGALFLAAGAYVVPHQGVALIVPGTHDLIFLLILATACTLFPFVMALTALRVLPAFGTQLVVNLEPIYTILLAIPLFGEQRELDARFYLGVAIVVGVVFVYPVMMRRR
jgi:drug/metabolite transporter (DMT)-like permease